MHKYKGLQGLLKKANNSIAIYTFKSTNVTNLQITTNPLSKLLIYINLLIFVGICRLV